MQEKSRTRAVPNCDAELKGSKARVVLVSGIGVDVRFARSIPSTRRWTWVQAERSLGEFEVVARFLMDLESNSATLKELRIRPVIAEWAPDIDEISPTLLRAISLPDLRAAVEQTLGLIAQVGPVPPVRADAFAAPERVGRPREWTDEKLARMAQRYLELYEQRRTLGETVYEVLGRENFVKPQTAADLIGRARDERVAVLTATRRGRGGGALTSYGKSLIEGTTHGTR